MDGLQQQKEILQRLMTREDLRARLNGKCQDAASLDIAMMLQYFSAVEEAVTTWGRRGGDAEGLLSEARECLRRDIILDILGFPTLDMEKITKEIAQTINEAYRKSLHIHRLPETDYLTDTRLFWPSSAREDYTAMISAVRFGLDQMQRPDSIFDSPSSCYVDMTENLAQFDGEAVFSAYLEPAYSPRFGQVLYRWGSELDRVTTVLKEGRKQSRIWQAEALIPVLREMRAQCTEELRAVMPAQMPVGLDRWMDAVWREKTGDGLFA